MVFLFTCTVTFWAHFSTQLRSGLHFVSIYWAICFRRLRVWATDLSTRNDALALRIVGIVASLERQTLLPAYRRYGAVASIDLPVRR